MVGGGAYLVVSQLAVERILHRRFVHKWLDELCEAGAQDVRVDVLVAVFALRLDVDLGLLDQRLEARLCLLATRLLYRPGVGPE